MKSARLAVVVGMAMALALFPRIATSQLEPTPIIVVDVQQIMREAAAVVAIQEQIDVYRQTYQEEFGRVEQDLRAAEAQLAEDREHLPQEEFIQLRREFERTVVDLQREAQQRRSALDGALNDGMTEVRAALIEVITEIAREQGARMVLDRSNVVIVDSVLDFSDEALARLNQRLSTIAIVVPE